MEMDTMGYDTPPSTPPRTAPHRNTQLLENERKKERACWILKLRDGNRLTQSCTENIIANVSDLCMQLVGDIN